jgi:hypothetical protein
MPMMVGMMVCAVMVIYAAAHNVKRKCSYTRPSHRVSMNQLTNMGGQSKTAPQPLQNRAQ